jgi:hypothetical protein
LSYHLYCALRRPQSADPALPPGVGGQTVHLVCREHLGLAVSRVAGGDLSFDLAGLRAHEQVVASLHRHRTVIPWRYGCRLADESQVARLLLERGPRYAALLQELDGCVEMGIRLLVPAPTMPPAAQVPEGLGDDVGPTSPPGLAYLKAREVHYRRLEGWSREHGRLARELESTFSGLFAKVKAEGPAPRLPLLSLYFLVPRVAVASFRRRFRRFSRTAGAKLLLSGPWPPYNFVTDNGEQQLPPG